MTRAMAVSIVWALAAGPAMGGSHYDWGASDSEIKIGNIAPYTGSASEYAAVTRAEAAYFQMVNDRGGIHHRKLQFISVDDGSDPERAIDLARHLVEQDQVLTLFSTFGTETNLAIRAYANEHKVPQLFVEASSAAFDDPAHFPWTMGFFATYQAEGRAYAHYLLQTKPDARIALLYETSDAGLEYRQGIRDGLGSRAAAMIVKEVTYTAADATLSAQMQLLKNSGADVFIDLAWGRMATEAIRTAYDIDWHPLQFIPNASLSVAAFLEPAGLEKANGIITNARSKGWLHHMADRDPEVRDFLDWMAKYNPQASLRDQNYVAGYERAEALVAVLTQCGDDLTRANVMAQAAKLDLALPMLRPGIRVKTSPTDYQPIKQLFLLRFDGKQWTSLDTLAGA